MDEFLLTLMRLRLNLMLEDLAYRFRVSSSTASRISQVARSDVRQTKVLSHMAIPRQHGKEHANGFPGQ